MSQVEKMRMNHANQPSSVSIRTERAGHHGHVPESYGHGVASLVQALLNST
jgi:hypothetical protein